MICSNCNYELPESVDYCPTCQALVRATGLTEESPQQAATSPTSGNPTVRTIPQPADPESIVALDVAVTRDVTRKSVWRPSNTKVRDWQNEALNHYELLELSRDAGDEIIQSRIALLDQAL